MYTHEGLSNLSCVYSHVGVMQGLEILIMENSQLGDKLLLLLQHVADDLLPVVNILGQHLLCHHTGLLGLRVLGVHLLHIVAWEPPGLPVQGPLPPTPVLALGDGD